MSSGRSSGLAESRIRNRSGPQVQTHTPAGKWYLKPQVEVSFGERNYVDEGEKGYLSVWLLSLWPESLLGRSKAHRGQDTHKTQETLPAALVLYVSIQLQGERGPSGDTAATSCTGDSGSTAFVSCHPRACKQSLHSCFSK